MKDVIGGILGERSDEGATNERTTIEIRRGLVTQGCKRIQLAYLQPHSDHLTLLRTHLSQSSSGFCSSTDRNIDMVAEHVFVIL